MAELIRGLTVDGVRASVERVRAEIRAAAERAGRDPATVELLAAVKYVAVEDLGVLAEAGITLVGENRAQELVAKSDAWPGRFQWDFIGHLQSRKVRQLAGRVRLIHSVASTSALAQLAAHSGEAPGLEILVEVNISGEEGKSGVAPQDVGSLIAAAPVPVTGLMTMPPLAADPEASRPWFRALCELAAEHGLPRLSMGTTQDYVVAVEEGATIVRIGTTLYR